jgi:lipoprotein-anchoring transpeptidase ErfK/SrfK
VAGCSGGGGSGTKERVPDQPKTTTTLPPPKVSFTPTEGQEGVALNASVVVSVPTGRLKSVSVSTGPKDKAPITGQLDPAGSRWTSTAGLTLAADAAYTVTADVEAKDGSPSVATSSFTTLKPAHQLTARVSPLNGSTVGVGHPIALYLSKPVADRAAVERRLTVTADPPVAGSWLWVSSSQLRWRPQQYWQAHTKVTFDASLAGVDFGEGIWGTESRKIAFKIGDSHISVVDADTYKMTVTTNGVLERTIPVSLGRAKYPTKSGVHVVMDKERTTIMDSASFGVPAGSSESYSTKVEWATRISNSGEFVHSAPWSVKDQGRRHVSHGCVNISPANAKWFFNYSLLGDVVEVKGTPVTIEGTNGFGDWNVPYPAPTPTAPPTPTV